MHVQHIAGAVRGEDDILGFFESSVHDPKYDMFSTIKSSQPDPLRRSNPDQKLPTLPPSKGLA
jgi:hypothetical protein